MTTRPGYIWSGTEWVSIGQEAVETPFSYQATAPTSPSTGDIWVDSDAIVSGLNTNDYLLKADIPTTPVYKMISGTTAERPTGAAGLFRFNTTTGYPEWYDTTAASWFNFYQQKIVPVEYLVLAGGGGGGNGGYGGGGGAGGYLTNTANLNISQNYTITIGAGGSVDANGSNSIFGAVTSIGGGSGGPHEGAGYNGGSGGGAGGAGATFRAGGSGTSGQGYAGGNNAPSSGWGPAGGGGGASAAGQTATTQSNAGVGGNGLASSITGSSVTRGGGGGGGGYAGNNNVSGGTGGGGATSVAGTVNTGGGGGGSRAAVNNAAAGGSGIVIIAYPNTYANLTSIGSGLTYTLDTASRSGYKVYIFTAGTGSITV